MSYRLFLPGVILFFLISACHKVLLYEWRGPERSGVYTETNLQKQWPDDGPELIFEIKGIGNGYVSPIVTDDAMFFTGEIDSMAHLFKYNLEGERVWNVAYDREWVKSYRGARSHPTIIEDKIYLGSGYGNLFCINAETGETIWSKSFEKDFDGQFPLFGHSEAPVVDGDYVFWTPGGQVFNVVALNRFTGELVWSNEGYKERSGYNNPKMIRVGKRNLFVTFTAYHLLAFDAETGKMLWSHEQTNTTPETREKMGMGDTHANTVLYDDGAIYYAEGDGNCGVKLLLSADGSEITQVWNSKELDGFMGGIVKLGNQLFGDSAEKRRLVCANAATGEITDSLKIGSGAVIAADQMLYFYNNRGQVFLIDYLADGKMKIVSSFKVNGGTAEHFAHPVIHNGVLYIRHGDSLMAYNIRRGNRLL